MTDVGRLNDFIRQLANFESKKSFVAKLNEITSELSLLFQMNVYFCEIKGKRWSFVVGSEKAIYTSNRFQLTDRWGIITDNISVDNDEWTLILELIRNFLVDPENREVHS
jgi:hypothetical protein